MTKLLLISVALILMGAGCFPTTDELNQQRIDQKLKCDEAGMGSYIANNGFLFCQVESL